MDRLQTKGFIILFSVVLGANLFAQPLAFPGAEGYGKYTKGGRGGTVYEVTNLNDSGKGSLREAVEAEGARTVVFRVSGIIELENTLSITNPYITIAGQTAPGDGICISNYTLTIRTHDVIIRYLRLRPGDTSGKAIDALSGYQARNVIIDHLSTSWSVDETLSIYHCDSITVQWCIISESLYDSKHPKGPHGYGAIWGGNFSSYHHNLFAHHSSRNPRFSSGSENTDFRNNVIYNWGFHSIYGGEAADPGRPEYNFSYVNIVANYFKPGPATKPGKTSYRIVSPSSRRQENDYGKWHVTGNYMAGNEAVSRDNWNGGVQPQDGVSYLDLIRMDEAFEGTMPITEHTATEAYKLVLNNAGATLPKRDEIDTRIIYEVRKGTATYEGKSYRIKHLTAGENIDVSGIIDSQNEVGGWPPLKSIPPPEDTDHDGIPDSWEDSNGLDKKNPQDGNSLNQEGYTRLEEYLNSLTKI